MLFLFEAIVFFSVSECYETFATPKPFFRPTKFNPLPLVSNPHAQTVAGALMRGTPSLPDWVRGDRRKERVETPDGGFFVVDIIAKKKRSSAGEIKIVVMLHGLESSSDSPLCQAMGSEFMKVGIDEVHCICFRGCGEPSRTAGGYHLGFTEDLTQWLGLLRSKSRLDSIRHRVYLSGFSLGANVVLKCLGEVGGAATSHYNVCGAAVACVPFDCELCQPKLDAVGFNRAVYSRNFLKTLVRKTEEQYDRGLLKNIEGFQIERVMKCDTIGEFDDAVVAPIYGFTSNIDYYRKASCASFLNSIDVPFYCVGALDDPFFDKDCYVEASEVKSGLMHANYTPKGGHCGFVCHLSEDGSVVGNWMPNELARFVEFVEDSKSSSK